MPTPVKTPRLLPAPRAQVYLVLCQLRDDVPRLLGAHPHAARDRSRLREWATKLIMVRELVEAEGVTPSGGRGRLLGDLYVVLLILDGILMTMRAEQEAARQGEPLRFVAAQQLLWEQAQPRLERAIDAAGQWATEERG